jgi:protocatechuate 3,4-dioxygenase beta subunit
MTLTPRHSTLTSSVTLAFDPTTTASIESRPSSPVPIPEAPTGCGRRIHFEVYGRFERLITQMYFPDEPLNAGDRLLNAALRPDLLIAKPVPSEDGSGLRMLNFDIVLARG